MSKGSNLSKCAWMYVCLAVLALLISAGRVQGQAQTATISGTATDASGGALAGARVQATNVGTNTAQSTTTDAQGRYTISQLAVGTYSLEASLSGFQTVVHKGVTLSVGGTLVVDFSLPVGEVTQTVNVESDVSRVETETSEISTLISPQQMRDLPLNGRNFEQLITLAPGVSTVGAALNAVTGRLYGMMDNYSVSGSRPTGQMFLLDGTDIRDFWEHGTGSGYGGTSLGVEAIGEFQVLTNTYTAQFAGNGAVINATSRSGTNDLHGGAYEFFRNNVLDARDVIDPLSSGAPPFRRNQFGVDLGGPIKKDKIFFFGNWEGLRQSLATTTDIFLPEPYLVQGKINCGSVGGAAAAPITVAGSCVPSTAANSTQPGILIGTPQNSFSGLADPNAREEQIAALYSLCKGCKQVAPTAGSLLSGNLGCAVAGCDLGGYYQASVAPPLIVNEDYIMGRVDYTLGTNDSLFGRYTIDNAKIGDPRDPLGIFPETDHTRNQLVTITERHVFSATLVNSLRVGFVRNNENSAAQMALTSGQISAANTFSTALGGPAITTDPLRFVGNYPGELPRQDGQNSAFNGIPNIGPDPNRPDEIVQNKFSGGDDIVWTHGAHSLKFGAVVTRIQTQNLQTAYSNGGLFLVYATVAGPPNFFYNPPLNFPKWLFDRNSYVGQVWLEGEPLVAFAVPQGANNATRYFREILINPYIQDDWKVTSRLTLNLGFRYDYDTNPVGWAFGNQPMTTIVNSYLPPIGPELNAGKPFTPVRHVFANNINAGNFEPRFGFAFDPFKDHRTSIRGGVGVFDDPTSGRLWESNFINTAPSGFSVPAPVFCFDHSCDTPVQFPNICGPGLPAPDTCNVPGATGEFAGVTYQPKGGSPYQITYNLNVQREVFHNTILSIGYVGSVSRHLWTQGDINPPKCLATAVSTAFPNCTQLPQIPKSRPTATDATFLFVPAGGCVDPAQNVVGGTGCYGSGVNIATLAEASGGTQSARINPQFASVVNAVNSGASSYSSLQVSLNRQFAHDIAGQVNYTWSRCIDDGSFASSLEEFAALVQDRYNERYDYGNCTFDIRHNISANGLYALPFKGNRLVEGWQISSIVGIHTGLPLNVYNGINFNDPGDLGSQWASRANYSFAPGCSPNHLLKQKSYTAQGNRVVQWFDPACYEAQAPGFLGNVKRDSLPGPGTFSADISITKNTKITERLNMQFRTECFNCFNHFNVGGTGAGILGAINEPGGTAGQTTFSQSPVVTPRQIQFAVKFDF
ncbi:MAG TPA: TonB-dependent receptor [Candidatus Acidoferrales bacterium]|nr:TonB-dependent receptor [Candidatus Acidoferrales bacterium]